MTAGRVQRRPVTVERIAHVVRHMRDRDRAEIYALRWNDDEAELVTTLERMVGAMCCVWELDGVPVSLQGAIALRPHVWDVFAFGTDDWPRVLLSMTRHARRFIIPALLRADFRRAECRALETHTDSRRWIEALGAQQESILRHYGRDDETFVSYVWGPGDVHKRR